MENLHQLSNEGVKQFVLAGKAMITLESKTSGTHFTYKVNKAENKDIWFISLLSGNNNDEDYRFMGYFTADMILKTSAKSKVTSDAPAYKAMDFTLKHVVANKIPEALKIYHSCRCGRCGRTLTTPESIQRGIGPECITML